MRLIIELLRTSFKFMSAIFLNGHDFIRESHLLSFVKICLEICDSKGLLQLQRQSQYLSRFKSERPEEVQKNVPLYPAICDVSVISHGARFQEEGHDSNCGQSKRKQDKDLHSHWRKHLMQK